MKKPMGARMTTTTRTTISALPDLAHGLDLLVIDGIFTSLAIH